MSGDRWKQYRGPDVFRPTDKPHRMCIMLRSTISLRVIKAIEREANRPFISARSQRELRRLAEKMRVVRRQSPYPYVR